MTIAFSQVPTSLRVPFVAAEFNNQYAQQGPAQLNYRALLIGQKLAAGSGTANAIVKVSNVDQVIALAGRGSILHRQALAFFANNRFTDCYIGILSDNGAGVAAAGTLTVTGPATAAGTISLYVGGVRVPVSVASGDSANSIASAISTAINATPDLAVTSSPSSAVVTVTFRHKGEVGNQYDMRVSYQDGEALPAGVAVAVVALTGGTTNPVLTSLIAALGDLWFHVWAFAYTDSTSLTAIETELESRFGPMRMIDGVAITATSDTVANLATLGNGRNSSHVSIVDCNKAPSPPMEIAAATAAVVAFYGNGDPARPFQTLPLAGIAAPAESDRRTLQERNTLLYDGISTTKVVGGILQLDRMITTYKTSASGAADTSYLDLTTMLTLLYLRYSFRSRIASRFARHKLANDGTRVVAGQAIVTPKLARAESIAWFRDMEDLGLVENFDQFKTDLVAQRNGSDPNRLDILLPPDIINSLIVTAARIDFRV
jgi:phage tail sheath gpL-like